MRKLSALVLTLVACADPAHPPKQLVNSRTQAPAALFSNGGFESGNLNSWTVTTNLNPGINYPPASVSDLNLAPGGTAFTFARTGATEATVPVGLSNASTLRFPRYGSWSAVVNEQGANRNVSKLLGDAQ